MISLMGFYDWLASIRGGKSKCSVKYMLDLEFSESLNQLKKLQSSF